jgi:hypothetical protein
MDLLLATYKTSGGTTVCFARRHSPPREPNTYRTMNYRGLLFACAGSLPRRGFFAESASSPGFIIYWNDCRGKSFCLYSAQGPREAP